VADAVAYTEVKCDNVSCGLLTQLAYVFSFHVFSMKWIFVLSIAIQAQNFKILQTDRHNALNSKTLFV